jgi:uncharacterized protein YjbJ (UPF0337 family)
VFATGCSSLNLSPVPVRIIIHHPGNSRRDARLNAWVPSDTSRIIGPRAHTRRPILPAIGDASGTAIALNASIAVARSFAAPEAGPSGPVEWRPQEHYMEEKKDKLAGQFEEGKGDLKESAGDFLNDEQMQGEGKVDQAKGGLKQGIADAKEKIADFFDGDDDKK